VVRVLLAVAAFLVTTGFVEQGLYNLWGENVAFYGTLGWISLLVLGMVAAGYR